MSARADKSVPALSDIDREILKILLVPIGNIKTETIATKLKLPISTIRRRRKRLETEFLKTYRVLDIEKFGWRRVDFFIAIKNGMVNAVASKLLDSDEVTYVGKSIGEHTIDLRVETIVKDNASVLDILEKIKAKAQTARAPVLGDFEQLVLLGVARMLESEPGMVGSSAHLIVVGRKPRGGND